MFQKVTELAPENYAGYVNLGGASNDFGAFSRSSGTAEEIDRPGPELCRLCTDLGTSYLGLHKLNEAAEAYEQAVKIKYQTICGLGKPFIIPGLFPALNGGRLRFPAGKAIELASEELKVNPHDVDVLSNTAVYYAISSRKSWRSSIYQRPSSTAITKKRLLGNHGASLRQSQ